MMRSFLPSLGAALVVALLGACDDRSDPEPEPPTAEAEAEASDSAGFRHERAFAFTTTGGDSALVVAFLFGSREEGGTVHRRTEGWLAGGQEWDGFVDRTTTGPEGAPAWRILPDGPVRLVVGDGDAVERVAFTGPPRLLELDLRSALAEWPGRGGRTYRIDETTLLSGDGEVPGVTLDLSRSWSEGDGPGDWAFLVSGDSLQAVLDAPAPSPPEGGRASAFVRLDFRNLQWPEVEVSWSDERAYDPARRNVPAGWRVTSETGEIEGTLEARTAALSADDDEGPVRPVRGLLGVEGVLEIEGAAYPVRGIVRHRQE